MVANQMSVDYLKTEDFARRPLAWLDLITRNKQQTMSYSPTFGYDICARRISSQTDVAGLTSGLQAITDKVANDPAIQKEKVTK